MEKETNLFDLFLMAWRGVKRVCRCLWQFMKDIVRLTFRKYWITLPIVLLFIALSFYYTRQENSIYKVYSVATLNGPSLALFDEVFRPLQSGVFLGENPAIAQPIHNRVAYRFETFPVIDNRRDSTIDYIDFNRRTNYKDTVDWQMRDHICIQFMVKHKHLSQIPAIEQQLLEYLNTNEAMQRAYKASLPMLDREVVFCHDQVEKLDSLTSAFYFNNVLTLGEHSANTIVAGDFNDRRIELFLPMIYQHIDYTRKLDIRRAEATAPVVLASHFAINPHVVNGKLRMLVLFAFVGWLVGLFIAKGVECIGKKKESLIKH